MPARGTLRDPKRKTRPAKEKENKPTRDLEWIEKWLKEASQERDSCVSALRSAREVAEEKGDSAALIRIAKFWVEFEEELRRQKEALQAEEARRQAQQGIGTGAEATRARILGNFGGLSGC